MRRIVNRTLGIGLTAAMAFAIAPAMAHATERPVDGIEHSGSKACDVTVMAHRGASGYRPEHTEAAYRLAVRKGADVIEPDLVPTADGVLIARHENNLAGTTDVADHPEFADRYTTKTIDGQQISGWFSEDFTLAEIKTLRAVERLPDLRTGNTRFDGRYPVLTFDEVVAIAEEETARTGRTITVYPEMKHPSYFNSIGLPIEELLADALHTHDLADADSPAWVQSFEVESLETIAELVDNPVGLNIGGSGAISDAELDALAEVVDVISLNKDRIYPRDEDGAIGGPTDIVDEAHERGMDVHVWTFRNENQFLPANLRKGDDPARWGRYWKEYQAFASVGVDAVFSDFPDAAVRSLRHCQR